MGFFANHAGWCDLVKCLLEFNLFLVGHRVGIKLHSSNFKMLCR